MSGHPRRCQGCEGSGWADGPTLTQTIRGRPHEYATVVLCTHEWWRDDTGWDPYYDEPLERNHPRAEAAYARGYAQGLGELANIQQPTTTRNPRQEGAA